MKGLNKVTLRLSYYEANIPNFLQHHLICDVSFNPKTFVLYLVEFGCL